VDRTQAERISVRMAVFIGFTITSGLWAYTGYAVTQQISDVKNEAAAVTVRYDQRQQLLATVRTQVLLSSVHVRDALLARSATVVAEDRERAEESFRLIAAAIEDYEPVARWATDGDQLVSLRTELDRFHLASINALGSAPGRSSTAIREYLNEQLMPRRESVLGISEQIQALNRRAYIGRQNDIAGVYEAAERKSRWQLSVALVLSLVVLLMTGVYAEELDMRLGRQLTRDVRLSRELFDVGTQLPAARADASGSVPGKPQADDALD
jgi:hypothetical protein